MFLYTILYIRYRLPLHNNKVYVYYFEIVVLESFLSVLELVFLTLS